MAIPPLVFFLLLVGVVRFVSFVNTYGGDRSLLECLSLARGLGRFESLAAPFLVAAVWLVVYPVVLGMRAVLRHRDRRWRRRLAVSAGASPRVRSRSSGRPSSSQAASGARQPNPAA